MNRDLLVALGWAGAIVLVSLAARIANNEGYISDDTMLRVVAMNGLAVAYYGNRIPKTFVPNADARRARWVAGWSMVLGGLVYAGFWAFAPLSLAKTVGTGALAVGVLVTVGYSLWLWTHARAQRPDVA
jgi:hypothetical protein